MRAQRAKCIAMPAGDDRIDLGYSSIARYYGKNGAFAELHVHLEGSVEPETLRRSIRR